MSLLLRGTHGNTQRLRWLMYTALASFAGITVAEPYEQTQGEGYTVCKAFEPYLADRTANNPMMCEIDLGNDPNGFSRPDWEELSFEDPENLELFRQLDKSARDIQRSPANDRKHVRDLSPEEWLRDFNWRREQPNIGEPRLLKARLGLDGEGEDETVVAVTWGTEECRQNLEAGLPVGGLGDGGPYSMFIYDEATRQVNLDLTGGPIHYVAYRGMDPLIFQDRAFLFTTGHSPAARASWLYITTYYARPGRASAVSRCTFEAKHPR